MASGSVDATLLIRDRIVFDDGAIHRRDLASAAPDAAFATRPGIFVVLWFSGDRVIGYDNERGKGDHRHLGPKEDSYRFVSIEQLPADFRADVEMMRGERL